MRAEQERGRGTKARQKFLSQPLSALSFNRGTAIAAGVNMNNKFNTGRRKGIDKCDDGEQKTAIRDS